MAKLITENKRIHCITNLRGFRLSVRLMESRLFISAGVTRAIQSPESRSGASRHRHPSRLHELHESNLPFVSRIEFIRSKLSNFSAHVFAAVIDRSAASKEADDASTCRQTISAGRRTRGRRLVWLEMTFDSCRILVEGEAALFLS